MSLDRAAVIRHTVQLAKTLELAPNDVVLSAGAAMVMLGLRKYTSDLDVDVPPEFFEKQKARKGSKQGIMGEYVEWDGMVDLHPFLSTTGTRAMSLEVGGVYIYHPQYLLDVKEVMANHPERSTPKSMQDYKDIQELKALLEKTGAYLETKAS